MKIVDLLKKADMWVSRITRFLCVFSLSAIVVMFLLNVLVRFVPVYNFTQTDDWIQIFLVWMIFLGAQELVRTRNHFVVEVLTEKMQGSVAHLARVIVCVIELMTYAIICYYGWVWVLKSQAYMQSIPWMQVRVCYAAIPVSAFFMTCYGIRDLVIAIKNIHQHYQTIKLS